jgi:ABC-type Fe3+-hydroxamate transport system substrate-binding protein
VILAGGEMPGLERRPEWRTLRAIREGRVVRLTESSSNRPSPRAPQAVRSLRARLASFTALTPSGDSR